LPVAEGIGGNQQLVPSPRALSGSGPAERCGHFAVRAPRPRRLHVPFQATTPRPIRGASLGSKRRRVHRAAPRHWLAAARRLLEFAQALGEKPPAAQLIDPLAPLGRSINIHTVTAAVARQAAARRVVGQSAGRARCQNSQRSLLPGRRRYHSSRRSQLARGTRRDALASRASSPLAKAASSGRVIQQHPPKSSCLVGGAGSLAVRALSSRARNRWISSRISRAGQHQTSESQRGRR